MTVSSERRDGVRLRTAKLAVLIGSRAVLSGIDLEARPGSVLVVTGPAGSGKTTLLHVLAGIISPSQGEATLDGESATRFRETKGSSIGFVPQTLGLAAALTAAENIAVPLQLLRLARQQVAARVQETLAALGIENAGEQLATELSGGQQQRAAVGRAIIAEPRLIIADEPTSELDAVSRDVVYALLREAADQGATVVMATHDFDLVERGDDVVYLHDGRLAD
jgi:putative ABC transport system ATP-binding protein